MRIYPRFSIPLWLMACSCAPPKRAYLNVDTESDDGSAIPDLPIPCEPGETRCAGVCVDLQANDDHCGICGFFSYDGYDYDGDSYCKFGECTPTIQGCLREESGVTTCAEFCVSFGEECRDHDDELDYVYAVELTATSFPKIAGIVSAI